MGHRARISAGRMTRTVALVATLVMATAGSTMAGPDTGELPVAGFTHTSVVDDLVGPTAGVMPRPKSLADVYAWLANPTSSSRPQG